MPGSELAGLRRPASDRRATQVPPFPGKEQLGRPDRSDVKAYASANRPLIAAMMRSALGITLRSRRSLNGIGTSGAPTRATGASSQSNAASVTEAAISPPKPPNFQPSWTTTRRLVRLTDATIGRDRAAASSSQMGRCVHDRSGTAPTRSKRRSFDA